MNQIITKAEKLTITTPEDLSVATTILSELNKEKDAITEEKEKVTRPLLDALNAERARWKPRELQLDTIITKVRGAMVTFQTALVAKQKLEQEKIVNKLEDGKIKPETAIRKLGELDTVDKKVETESGSISFKTVKKFEMVSPHDVPVEYLLLNEVKVREEMKQKKEIKGVKYWEEQVPINLR